MTRTSQPSKTASGPEVTQVPIHKLTADPDNVRKKHDAGIAALADNILAEGLLQNLVVRKLKGGKFGVVAGERRRRALAALVKSGKMKATATVPCRVIEQGATGASLSENIHRAAMHPADQYEAWVKLHEQGLSVSEIATRHGATSRLVEQRLKLGRLSPVLLNALREDEIDIEVACAFTLSDDTARQESVFEALRKQYLGMRPSQVKSALTGDEIPSTHKLGCFVGRKAYEAAGGTIRSDLFDEVFYYKDAECLTRLASEKLEAEAERIKSQGWAWVEFGFERDYRAGDKMRRIRPVAVPLSAEDEKSRASLEARLKAVEDEADQGEEKAVAEYEAILDELEVLDEKTRAYKPEEQAIAGGFVWLSYNGTVDLDLGYIRSQDDPLVAEAKKQAKAQAKRPDAYSQSLRSDLAAIRLGILQAELLTHPEIASDLLVFHTVRATLSRGYADSPFRLDIQPRRGNSSAKGDMGRSTAQKRFKQLSADLPLTWLEHDDKAKSFDAFRALSADDKRRLQAYAAALMLKPQLGDEDDADPATDRAVALMKTDMAAYWRPDARFFSRLNKAQMLELLSQLVSPAFAQSRSKEKKAALAKTLERVFKPKAKMPGVVAAARKRVAAWVPPCMALKDR